MAVICKTCGAENTDPGPLVDLSTYSCGRCHNKTLYRQEKVEAVVASGVCAAVGAAVGGPLGAAIGGVIGYWIGNSAQKEK